MKNLIILSLMIIFLRNLYSLSTEPISQQRDFDLDSFHEAGNMLLRVTNYGNLGNRVDQNGFTLIWPKPVMYNETNVSGTNYLYANSLWFGAKKYRRNELGEKLYWLPDANNENDVIPSSHSDWSPDLQVVVDTLTTVGFDGDSDLFEFLPAYNPYEWSLGDQYDYYNNYDEVVFSRIGFQNYDDDNDGAIDEDNLGSPFDFNSAHFCFTKPYDDDGDGITDEDVSTPGVESSLAYFYDYSPFPNGYDGERDWGLSQGSNKHYPLNVAVKQETFTYPTQYYADMMFVKYILYNTSELDTLYDCAIAQYVDADIGPVDWSAPSVANDDKSSFVNGDGYNFAYAFDADGDQGLSTGLMGFKMFIPQNEVLESSCWYWNVGQGPDDSDPLDVFSSWPTANEKYWLMTGINPQEYYYTNLMLENQQSPGDTRFLYSVYGDQNGFDDPSDFSINIPPNSDFTFYSVIFFAHTISDLKDISILATEFYESDFDESLMEDLPSFPVLHHVKVVETSAELDWYCFTTADQQFVYIKEDEAPASEWQEISVATDISHYEFTELNETIEYDFKIGVYYGDVYLESSTITAGSDLAANEEDIINPIGNKLQVFPNPFNPSTTIEFNLPESSKTEVSIYNLKGQKIKKLLDETLSAGNHQIYWNGKNEKKKTVSSGVYFIRLETGNKTETKKILLMK